MVEPHMILAILSLQKVCERPAGPKDEDAFYQQYQEPFYRRLYETGLRLCMKLGGRRPSCKDVQVGRSRIPKLEACN